MATHILDPVCKMCRREGMKLYLKGSRCDSPKCPIDREMPPPGMHGYRRGKPSEYGIRLREKQKLKRFYGVLERQFRRYFELATRSPENTGESCSRFWSAGWTTSSTGSASPPAAHAARQLVAHGHVTGQRPRSATSPACWSSRATSIKVKTRDRSLKLVRESTAGARRRDPGLPGTDRRRSRRKAA